MMVGIYRTPEAVEAAWKYFILGSVGIALAFFGTILIYLAAQDVLGEGLPAMAWDLMSQKAASSIRSCCRWPSCSCWSATAPRWGWRRSTPGCPTPMPKGPTPISAVLSGLLLNVALYALLRFKMIMAANPARCDGA